MFEYLSEIPFVSLFIKFMIASTVLLGAVWLMEKVRLINRPDLAELAWKAAIAGSFIALIPIADFMSSTLVVQNQTAANLIGRLNEERPLSEFAAPSRIVSGEIIERDIAAARQPQPRASVQVQGVLEVPAAPLPARVTKERITKNNNIVSERIVETPITTQTVTKAAGDAGNPEIFVPEGDSEISDNLTIWQSAATLRSMDLAALGWIGLAFLALSALIVSYRAAVRNLGSRKRVQAEDHANKVLRSICEQADIRHVPYLSRSSDLKSPVCLPRKEICLPDWAFDAMPEEEFKSLLAHELGHMVRRDPIMLMALQVLSRTFFFQPLFILARRRLTDIAELAADEWAAAHTSDTRAVANALFICATKIHETRQIQWGLAMAGNKSILKRRVERLIGAESTPFQTTSTLAKSALAVGVIGLGLGLPSIEFADAHPHPEPKFVYQFDHGEKLAALQALQGLQGLQELQNLQGVEGLESLNDKLAELGELGKLGELGGIQFHSMEEFEAKMEELSRELEGVGEHIVVGLDDSIAVAVSSAVEAATEAMHVIDHGSYTFHGFDDNDSGNITWHDDGWKLSINWEGDFSISDDDSTIIAEDDYGFVRIKSKEGDDRRLIKFEVEDGKTQSTYYKDGKKRELDADGKRWLKRTVRKMIETGFDAKDRAVRIYKKKGVKGVLAEVKSFKSDMAKRIYLSHLASEADLNDKEIGQVIDQVGTMDSDFEKRLTLSHLLEEEKVSDKALPKVLNVAKGMDSDFEKRLLVSHYVSDRKLNDKTVKAVIDIAASMDSDFEIRLLLTAALDDTDLSDKNAARILDLAIEKLDSDFEMRILMTTFADQFGSSDKVANKILDAVEKMDSSFEQRLLLSTFISEAKMNEKTWLRAIKIADGIDSDHEKSLVLMQMQNEIPEKNKKIVAALDEAMKDVRTDYFTSEDRMEIEREIAEAIREAEHAASEAIREAMQEFHHDREFIARETEKARAAALRSIERELSRLKRDQEKAKGMVARELARAARQLERAKRDLQRSMDRETRVSPDPAPAPEPKPIKAEKAI